MILIGQYDSPFVRRVAIAMRLYGIGFAHRPWSTFSDRAKVQAYNPLVRVPTLVLDDGTVLIESHMILDYLDEQVGAERALFPSAGTARRDALQIAARATGMADKAVGLFYEQRMHAQVSEAWVERCRAQVVAVARALEADRARQTGAWWFGERPGHADIAVAVALRFIGEAHPDLVPAQQFPLLARHAAQLEATPAFQEIAQPFAPPS